MSEEQNINEPQSPAFLQGAVMCRCSICDEDKNKKDMYDEICCYSCWNEEMTNYLYRNDSAHNST